MKSTYITEPPLQFGNDLHICPRQGITDHSVYDKDLSTKKSEIVLGLVGTAENCEQLDQWLSECASVIPRKIGTTKTNLFMPFPGFNRSNGFKCKLSHEQSNHRLIPESEIRKLIKIKNRSQGIDQAVDLYF